MKYNLFNEYVQEESDFVNPILSQFKSNGPISFDLSPGTIQGLEMYSENGVAVSHSKLHMAGFYAIYKNEGIFHRCIYIGSTSTSIASRLSRFVKEVNGYSTPDENHPAAKKYRELYGNDLSGVYFVYSNLSFTTKEVTQEDVEYCLIRELKGQFNKRIVPSKKPKLPKIHPMHQVYVI